MCRQNLPRFHTRFSHGDFKVLPTGFLVATSFRLWFLKTPEEKKMKILVGACLCGVALPCDIWWYPYIARGDADETTTVVPTNGGMFVI